MSEERFMSMAHLYKPSDPVGTLRQRLCETLEDAIDWLKKNIQPGDEIRIENHPYIDHFELASQAIERGERYYFIPPYAIDYNKKRGLSLSFQLH